MSTYEEFQIILGVAMLIVAILNLTHRKQRPCSGKVRRYFLNPYNTGNGQVCSIVPVPC